MSVSAAQVWSEAEQRFQKGDLDGAAAACVAVLSSQAGHSGAHWMLSQVFQAQRRFRLATSHARLAAADAGRLEPRARLAVSRALVSVGEYRAAMGVLRSLPSSTPLDAASLTQAVELAGMLDDSALAMHWLDVADARGIHSAVLSFLRGNHLKFLGDSDGAAAAYEAAIALDPNWPHPHLALATLGSPIAAASNVDRIRAILAGPAKSAPFDEAVLHYALFRELDTLDDPNTAWASLAEGMRLRRSSIRHDNASEARMFQRIRDTYTADFIAPVGDAPTGPQPVFIVGLPRSGTTLVERMIGNHPAVAACGELNDLRMRYKWASDYYCNGLLDEEAAARAGAVDAAFLGRAYLDATAWRAGGAPWYTDKLPANFLFSGLILRALPGARIVHVRRHPMAACMANLKEVFAPYFYEYSYSISEVAAHHREYACLIEHVARLAPERVLDVDYEAFVTNPSAQSARILRFLGLAPGQDQVAATNVGVQVSTASSLQVREPINTDRIAYWKRYERFLGPLRDALGAPG